MTQEERTKKLLDALMSLRHMYRRAGTMGIKHSEFGLLMMICHHSGEDGIKVSEISNLMKVTSPTVTQSVTALEARGLVRRRMDPFDRRIIKVSLTDKGREMARQAQQDMIDAFSTVVMQLGDEKSEQLAELLEQMSVIIEREFGHGEFDARRPPL